MINLAKGNRRWLFRIILAVISIIIISVFIIISRGDEIPQNIEFYARSSVEGEVISKKQLDDGSYRIDVEIDGTAYNFIGSEQTFNPDALVLQFIKEESVSGAYYRYRIGGVYLYGKPKGVSYETSTFKRRD